jgi:acyl-CoA synthetase (AMP-forming)/AMP-acid ligase II
VTGPAEDLRRAAELGPARDACVSATRKVSYGELLGAVEIASGALAQAGVGAGDRVAFVLANSPAFIAAYVAVRSIDAVPVPLDPRSGAEALARAVADADVAAIVTDPGGAPSGPSVRVVELPTVGSIGLARHRVAGAAEPQDTEGLAAIIYTSGSTGPPKGVMLAATALEAVAGAGVTLVDLGPEDRVGIVAPLFHLYALREIDAALRVGATLVVPRQLAFPASVLGELAAAHATVVSFVPALLALLLRHHAEQLAGLRDDLRVITIGTANASTELLDTVVQLLPRTRRIVTYGLTELSRACSREVPIPDDAPGTVGRPYPGVAIEVVGDDGRTLPIGETGRVILRSDMVMRGYWRRPELTAETLLPDGGLRTPDLGRLGERGGLRLLGRADEVINAGGEKIGPDEVEAALRSHPAVEDAAVAGVPDPAGILGMIVKAWVVLAPGERVSANELAAHCAARLESVKVPREIEFVDELPRAQLGKVTRGTLGSRG